VPIWRAVNLFYTHLIGGNGPEDATDN